MSTLQITKLNKTTYLNNTKIEYSLNISKHCLKEREYKSNKFENRLINGLCLEKINNILIPYLEQIFMRPNKYLFVINKNKHENEKISLLVAIEKDIINQNKYYITIITALHRDTNSILFHKIDHEYRIYTDITYDELLKIKTYSPHDAAIVKENPYVSNNLGLKIIKKVKKKDKYYRYKNISKLPLSNNTQKRLAYILKVA